MVLAGGLAWAWMHDISVIQIIAWVYRSAREQPWAPFAYFALYMVRPLTFLPAMWLTLAAGSLFGFYHGAVIGLIGENASAAIAYMIARFFRHRPADVAADSRRELSPFRRTLQTHALPTVIILRAAYLPFDLVNFGCGLLRVPWWPYCLGTAIGTLPPMLTYVSFGASLDFYQFTHHLEHFDAMQLFDTRQLLISVGLLVASGVIVWIAHRRRLRLGQTDAEHTGQDDNQSSNG